MKHYNLLRKAFIIVIIFSLAFTFLSGSTSSQKLDDLAYIVSMGIDSGDTQNYKISFQISTVQSSSSSSNSSGSESGSSSKSEKGDSYIINTIECDSVDTGIGLISTYVNRHVNLSHCKVVLISDSVAKNGISSIIYTLVNKVEMRPDCNVIISKTKAKDFINGAEPSPQDILSRYYNISSGNSGKQETEYTQSVSLSEFYSYLRDPLCEPFACLGTVSNPKGISNSVGASENNTKDSNKTAGDINSKSSEPLIELLGLAVFKNDKMVGELSVIETICHSILANKLTQTNISIPSPFDPGKNVDLFLSMNTSPKIKVYINNNGSPYVVANVDIQTRLLSFNDNISNISQDKISQVESAAKNYLTNELYNYLNKTSKDFKSDITGIGAYGARNFLTQQELDNYNWAQNYETCTFKVNVNLTLKSGYLLSNK